MNYQATRSAALVFVAVAALPACAGQATTPLDTLSFGDPASEQAHQANIAGSEIIQGGLDEPARRLLPRDPASWQGGTVSFTMKLDPAQPNYFTIRLWGDEDMDNRLILFGEGKQIGYLNEGDIDILDPGTEDRPFNGRFYYNTSPLPLDMTKGKT
ncbi:MAG: Tat pathway signal protein, partial [Armatimonadota bacterium]|nr:Tat pathway signal protein [Armatimonadota bacterium]